MAFTFGGAPRSRVPRAVLCALLRALNDPSLANVTHFQVSCPEPYALGIGLATMRGLPMRKSSSNLDANPPPFGPKHIRTRACTAEAFSSTAVGTASPSADVTRDAFIFTR